MARSKLPYLFLAAALSSCSSDGCSSGCGGVTPLPGGYPAQQRIENAAAVRITQDGMTFLEDNIGVIASNIIGDGSGVIEFPIDETNGAVDILFTSIDYTICPGGPTDNPKTCIVEIDLANSDVSINPENPHTLTITGQLPIKLQNLPIETDLGDVDLTLTGNQACPGENSTFSDIGVTIKLSVETDLDTTHARYGYSRIRVSQLTISKPDIENSIRFCNGGFVGTLLNFLKGLVVDQIFDSLVGTLDQTIEEQLCQKANPAVSPTCPTGTNDVSGVCRYGTDSNAECVPMVLGTDGHANLSGLLAGISPGTKGGMDFLFAGGGSSLRDDNSGRTWGDLNPFGGGATVGAFGGVEPNPASGCVPLSQMALPQGLKIPNEFIDDTLINDWPAALDGPHVGIGISEAFFNYSLNGMYNSGLLCIGMSTETIDLLTSDTLGLLAASLKDLSLQRESAPIAIVLKPRKPPTATFGNGTNLDTDPLIRLQLPEAEFDFYIKSHDRFIRFMSASFDIDAPMNLTVTPEGLVPVLDKLKIENGKVSNAELLKEDPTQLAATLQSLLSSQIGALLGSGLGAVDINGATEGLGLRLVIPESVEGQGSPGLRTVVKDGERFLGIFAALEVATMTSNIDTQANINQVDVDEEGLRGATLTPYNAPKVVVVTDNSDPAGRVLESQARVDGGIWKPWTRSQNIHLSDESLRLEGRHIVEVRSRAVGEPYSLDPTPEVLEVLIDTQAPEARVSAVGEDNRVSLAVYDLVSGSETLVRHRFDDGAFTGWRRFADIGAIDVPEMAEEIEVETLDEKGNVGTARQPIIRGLPRDADGGCGCVVAGEPARSNWAGGFAAALGAFWLAARRQRKIAKAKAGAQAGAQTKAKAGGPLKRTKRLFAKSALARNALGMTLVMAGGTLGGCDCDDENPKSRYTCEAPNCVALTPGLIGSYTSAVVGEDGKLWVAGYLEGDYDNVDLQGAPISYGDLVAGAYDGEKVVWEIIDGVPEEPAADGKAFDVRGFRGGQTEPGNDVGIWTSIAIDPSSKQPVIAYHDRTNKALKLATFSGKTWSVETVDDHATNDLGKYASLAFDGNVATIAYLAIESTGEGLLTSKVKIARKNGDSFSFEDAIVNAQTPCRPAFCSDGSVCLASEGACVKTASSCGDCGTQQCTSLGGVEACRDTLASKLDAYPLATGLYVQLAKLPSGGLGMAYYDRVAGTMNVAAFEGGAWKPVVVDGGILPDMSVTDTGVGLSLFIDTAGDWHVTYVDGYAEALKYARLQGGAVVDRETIDDGLNLNGTPNPDGLHVVGDDSNVRVSGQGEVQVTYQDATSGKLRYAIGTPKQAGGHDWTIREIAGDGFGGFFSTQVEYEGALRFVHFWRKAKETTHGDVTVSSP